MHNNGGVPTLNVFAGPEYLVIGAVLFVAFLTIGALAFKASARFFG